ncbi:Carbamoyl-phosphate synthase small subunit [Tenacibaculum aestuarii]
MTLLILVAFCLNALGQRGNSGRAFNVGQGSNGLGSSNNFLSIRAGNSGKWVKQTKNEELTGSVYLFDDWNNRGVIYSNDGKGYKLDGLNLNLELNRLEAKFEDKSKNSVYAFDPESVKKATIGNKVVKRIRLSDKEGEFFLEELSINDKVGFYKLYSVSIKYARLNPMTQKKMGNNQYIKEETYYIEFNGRGLEAIELKKSKILNKLKDKKEKVKKFIKENKLNVKEENDFIKLLNYYSSL